MQIMKKYTIEKKYAELRRFREKWMMYRKEFRKSSGLLKELGKVDTVGSKGTTG